AQVSFDWSVSATMPVCGLARFFPAGVRHGRRSTTPASADRCELTDTDHFHVHRVSAPLASLLDPTPPAQNVRTALAENCRPPSAATSVHVFPPLPDPAPCVEVTTTVLVADPLPDHPPNPRIATAYIIEATLLPVVELLAGSEELLDSLADALAEEEPGEHLAAFLRALLVAGRRDAELALLPHPARTPDGTDTTILGLF